MISGALFFTVNAATLVFSQPCHLQQAADPDRTRCCECLSLLVDSLQLATLFSWYAALLILWIRRPWYDTAWGENDGMSLNEADEEEEVRFIPVSARTFASRAGDVSAPPFGVMPH